MDILLCITILEWINNWKLMVVILVYIYNFYYTFYKTSHLTKIHGGSIQIFIDF